MILPDSPTISISEAAAVLGISQSTAYLMAERGELPTIKLSARRWRVPTKVFLAKYDLA